MRKSRFSDEQIVGILQEHAAGEAVGVLSRRHGISQQALYRWKQRYDGLEGQDVRRLTALEEENACLKRLVAELALNRQGLPSPTGKQWHCVSVQCAIERSKEYQSATKKAC